MSSAKPTPPRRGRPPGGGDARARILDVAERLFTGQGFAATSVRAITQEAGVSLASVNYHFGSKQGLMEAVYQRALGGDGSHRVNFLDKLERAAGGKPLAVGTIVDAYINSALRLTRKEGIPGIVFQQLIGRAFYEPGSQAETFFPSEYAEGVERYRLAFKRALPQLSDADIVWRMYCFVGVVAYVIAGKDIMRMTTTYKLNEAGDPEAILRRLKPAIVASFEAPAAGKAKRRRN